MHPYIHAQQHPTYIYMYICIYYTYGDISCTYIYIYICIYHNTLCYGWLLGCSVPSSRYTTARIRELGLASMALARSARCSSLLPLQRIWPDFPPLTEAQGALRHATRGSIGIMQRGLQSSLWRLLIYCIAHAQHPPTYIHIYIYIYIHILIHKLAAWIEP